MNVISLVGRLTKDPELRYNKQNVAYCRFTIATDGYKDKDGNKQADFINCICSKATAENLVRYQKKGNRIGLIGRLHTYSYEKQDGSREYSHDVIVNNLEYLESKPKDERPEPTFDEPIATIEQNSVDDPYKDFGDELSLSGDDLPF